MNFSHTPYDGTAKPFTIGLKPLDLADWIEIDAYFDAYLKEKGRLYAEIPDAVFREEPQTRTAQREALDLLRAHLPARFPDLCRAVRNGLELPCGRRVAIDGSGEPPLMTASRLVQEDLVLMRRGEKGWRLAAAAVCFPSSWSLPESFGRALHDVHVPVPGFGPGTRIADLITRIFDNLKPDQPVWRINWSLTTSSDLYLPLGRAARDVRAVATQPRFGADPVAASFVRVERQTLRRLPVSGDILFTIRIHRDPLAALAAHPDRSALANGLADQLAGLDEAQLAYKGLAADRDRFVSALRAMAGEAAAIA